ncbi:hypothetical protein ACS0TY_028684 [Phlomoides rotata]
MAETQEQKKPDERQIPVFTVLKNNCILKNIFLLDKPPSISSFPSPAEDIDRESEIEEILVVGRHPDCNIKLEHPSISRFHLRIHSKPSSRSLFVTDMSSVHGTWVSGRRIEHGVRVEVNEGDTLHLGASSRVYRLSWVPLSRAYDMDDPFVPQLDAPDKVDEETDGVTDQDQDKKGLSDHSSFSNEDEVEDNGLPEFYSKENELSSSQLCRLDTSVTVDEETEATTDQDGVCLYGSSAENNVIENNELPEVCNKENSTPKAHIPSAVSQAETTEYSGTNSDKMSVLSIWSRRGKPKSVNVKTSQSRGNSVRIESLLDGDCLNESMLKDQNESSDYADENYTPDKENTSPGSHLVRSLKCKFEETLMVESTPNTPISSVDQDEEIFTPDKENVTPHSHLFKSMKKSGEVKHPKSYRPSPLKVANNSSMYQESKSAYIMSKSRGGLKTKQSVYKARPDRDPLCPLLMNSSDRKPKSHTNAMKVKENRWTIIADTTSLLNRKSRKELQLLRGLRGTTLVIPRIVVRELDCMLKRASFFSRMTEASAALNWIEECMAATKWWIHVQNSVEEGRLVPPTPPAAAASPRWFSEEKSVFSVGSIPFSPCSLQEIVTPTAADHILDCALLFRRTIDGQLVLLSDDVALKIKAMAEGVVCETAEEFRRSVVNPFSPRFLYSDSSPIGPTWSCSDDAVLKENYYPSPSKKSGDRAKGLKLILLHNSNFRQMTN